MRFQLPRERFFQYSRLQNLSLTRSFSSLKDIGSQLRNSLLAHSRYRCFPLPVAIEWLNGVLNGEEMLEALLEGVRGPQRPYTSAMLDRIRKNARGESRR
jgi:hypothetical protein